MRRACDALMEHFDTVQIFVTRHEQAALDGTVNVAYGAGNWFARRGQVGHWCMKQDEFDKERARIEVREEES